MMTPRKLITQGIQHGTWNGKRVVEIPSAAFVELCRITKSIHDVTVKGPLPPD